MCNINSIQNLLVLTSKYISNFLYYHIFHSSSSHNLERDESLDYCNSTLILSCTEHGPWTNSICNTWKLAGNAECHAPLRTRRIRIYILRRSSDIPVHFRESLFWHFPKLFASSIIFYPLHLVWSFKNLCLYYFSTLSSLMAPHPTYHKAQTLYNNQQCPSRSDLYLLSDTLTSLKFLKLTNKTCLISSTPNTLLLVLTWVFLEHFSQFKCNCLEKILL